MVVCGYFNQQIQNVIYLGVCFMVLFAADYTTTNMQKTLISSIHEEKPDFVVEGYTSLGLTYTVFALSLWFGPSVVAVIGPRVSMSIAAAGFTLYILAFNVEEAWAIYTVVVVGGLAGGILWTAEGYYLVLNSNSATISRNVSIFWAFLQSSSLFGNLYTYSQFQGKKHIDGPTRRSVIYVLASLAALASIMFLFLRPLKTLGLKPSELNSPVIVKPSGPWKEFCKTWSMFKSKDMYILNIIFCYTGLQHAFIYAVYSPSIGFTSYFGNRSKQLVALSGICISLGEITGGGLQIIFSRFIGKLKYKRIGVIVFGLIIEICAYILIYLNLPNNSVFGETDEVSFIDPSATLAMLCSFLLGFGDSCMNTQNYSIIAVIFPNESAQSSALYKFIKSLFVAVGLYTSSHIGLHRQLSILLPMAVLGGISFVLVDRRVIAKTEADDTPSVEEREEGLGKV